MDESKVRRAKRLADEARDMVERLVNPPRLEDPSAAPPAPDLRRTAEDLQRVAGAVTKLADAFDELYRGLR